MKGLFDCLRNRIYREDEDILKQIAANAAVDDTEIEAFEADDEDDEDEWDLGGLNVDEIDDADIERVTNEFNMDEGNRAACRLKTIDLKEDAELYDEGLMANMREKRLDKKLNKMDRQDARMDRKEGIKQAKDKAKDARVDKFLANRSDSRQGHAKLSAERRDAYNKYAKGADERIFGGGKVRRGINAEKRAGVAGAKKSYRNVKRDQIIKKKAKQVAMEEGLSLDEALEYVLEYEESLLDEGYTYEEIYGEDIFEEDSVELQPETKLSKKVSQDPDMRDFVGAGDGSGHDMKTESFDLIMEEVMEEIELMDEGLMANMREKRLNKKLDKMELKDARMDRKEGIKQAKDKARDARVNAGLDRKADSRQGRAELSAERKAAYNKFAKGADERVFGGGKSRRGINAEKRAGIKDAKQAYRNVKRDQIVKRKAKSIAVEEGVSLDEALDFVLECELDLLDEGFTYEEIYEDALYEDAVEYQPETKLNRKVSLDPDMRDFVGAGDGSGHDMKTEDLDDEEIYEEGIISKIREKRLDKKLNRMALKDARMDRKEGIRGAKDSAKDARVDAFLDKRADGREGRATLAAERRAAYNKFADGRDERLFGGGKVRRGINAEKRADIRAAKDAYRNVKRDQIIRKKARDIAVEEGVSLDEALEYVLECEQDLLDEGFGYEEIYGEDVFEEDSVELQPETKLNRKVSQDPDMRDFVGAGDGSGHDMKTEAAILAYEEGISLEEAMEWLMEDEDVDYDEDVVDDAIAKLGKDGNDNGVFPTRVDLQDEVYDEDVFNEGRGKDAAMLAAGIGIPAAMAAGGAYLGHKAGKKIFKGKAKPVEEACGDADECAPKRQHQRPVGNVDAVSVDGIDTDDELMLGVEAVIREIEESLDLDDFDC